MEDREMVKINFDLLKRKQGFKLKLGNENHIKIVELTSKLNKLKQAGKLKVDEEKRLKRSIIYYLKLDDTKGKS